MAVSIPQLDVYCINLAKENAIDQGDHSATFLESISRTLFNKLILPGLGLRSPAISDAGISLTLDAIIALKRLFESNRFYTIDTMEELEKYENAHGNAWAINDKPFKETQYYIRHPKKLSRNILIEAKSFYDYIEEEQKDELIDYIMSHCSAKVIKIDRTEIVEVSGKAKANVEGADIYLGGSYGELKGNYYNFFNPQGTTKTTPRENYIWIDKSIMRSIAGLSKGSKYTQEYDNDLTFGLSVGEARTIGLDIGKRKKYHYRIHIEC